MHDDVEACYAALRSRDARFDGRFFAAVTTTGIYCRPVCPAQTPHAANVRFYPTAVAAEAAGFRACRRCHPHRAPGAAGGGGLADRALRLLAGGVADGPRGITAVADRLGISDRQLHRVLTAAVGAGPLSLARMRRLQTARTLLEQTTMPVTEVALCAGFRSLRQFNEATRDSLRMTPSEIRRRGPSRLPGDGAITLRLSVRPPFDSAHLLHFLARRAVAGVEACDEDVLTRSLRLRHGAAVVRLTPADHEVGARLWLDDMRDLGTAVERCRALFDLDADPQSVADTLGADPLLAPLVAARPGLRVPGCAAAEEAAIRAVLGQQVTVDRASAMAARLADVCGDAISRPEGTVRRLFPTAASLVDADLAAVGLTGERTATLRRLAAALAGGSLDLHEGGDPATVQAALTSIRGVGAWTAAYIALRGLRAPDALPAGDRGLERTFEHLGGAPRSLVTHAERWRPWRSYATVHLWAHQPDPRPRPMPRPMSRETAA